MLVTFHFGASSYWKLSFACWCLNGRKVPLCLRTCYAYCFCAHMVRGNKWSCESYFILSFYISWICHLHTDLWRIEHCFFVWFCTLSANTAHTFQRRNNWLRNFHFILTLCTLEIYDMLTNLRTLGRCFFVSFCDLGTVTAHIYQCGKNLLCNS